MQVTKIEAGAVIYKNKQELNTLQIILKGSVQAEYQGGHFVLSKGDVIGLSEVHFKTHFLNYTALEEVSVLTFPFYAGRIGELIEKNADIIQYFATSVFHQIEKVWSQYTFLKMECSSLFQFLHVSYDEYGEFCEQFNKTPRNLPQYEELEPLILEEDIEGWLGGYYESLRNILLKERTPAAIDNEFFVGLLSKASEDIHNMIVLCASMQNYRDDICNFLINENRLDLFEFYTSLYLQIGPQSENVMPISIAINEIMMQLEAEDYMDSELYEERVREYEERLKISESRAAENNTQEDDASASEELKDSLESILAYSQCSAEEAGAFREDIKRYKETINKNSTSDRMRELRLRLTKQFYHIYIQVFEHAVQEEKLPEAVMLFLQFGYVDEELAGIQNAETLLRIIKKLPSDPKRNVYTIFEWLKAIYEGKKEPCRNEFDMDFPDYIHELKRTGKITPQQEKAMLQDKGQRVGFEIKNMFPNVNKMTFGQITTFCPIFSEHNVLRPLEKILVTADRIETIFTDIRNVDYSAFYRETMYSNPAIGIPKEVIHVEVLPDVILMPNIGIRGVMWQEIEQKKRTTPARMMISIFQIEDLASIMLRLTGEFRWEMCRRIQGMRWNDISDPSLTSEYFDYIQFYRKNKDLSASSKDKIKVDMQKAKNSYKELFIRDYCKWVQFESSGSPRLNKVCRRIIFKYCPFAKSIREDLKSNPLYHEGISYFDVRASQRKRHMDNVFVKIRRSTDKIPEELVNQRSFVEA